MNIATISPISIQLKLINEYDPIFVLLAIKGGLKLKVFTFCLKNQKLAGKYKLSEVRNKDWQACSSAIEIRKLQMSNIEI